MSLEKATGLVVRVSDWSETSRIATLWTRELGKVRALAKGGRRLKSAFESSLDLLTVAGIVLLRKTSGSLDLLTEAQVQERFPRLRQDLQALYAGYYLAELLGDWTEDYDPHPNLYDEALATLRDLGQPDVLTGPRLAHFELALLRELGYAPVLDRCVECVDSLPTSGLALSGAVGGVVCPKCQEKHRECWPLSETCRQALCRLGEPGNAWRDVTDGPTRAETRQVLNYYVAYLRGRRPRLQPYLGS